jgi:hypothetical protein
MSSVVAAAPALAMGATQIIINPIDALLNTLNTNPYFIGVMMLLLNLGGRFLGMEMSKNQEKFFQQVWVRRFFIFTVLFIATRNVLIALFLSVIVLLVLAYLFNENSSLYLGGKTPTPSEEQPLQGLSIEETEILRRLSEKQMRYATKPTDKDKEAQKELPLEQIYMENIQALQESS